MVRRAVIAALAVAVKISREEMKLSAVAKIANAETRKLPYRGKGRLAGKCIKGIKDCIGRATPKGEALSFRFHGVNAVPVAGWRLFQVVIAAFDVKLSNFVIGNHIEDIGKARDCVGELSLVVKRKALIVCR